MSRPAPEWWPPCPCCGGRGVIPDPNEFGQSIKVGWPCTRCNGKARVPVEGAITSGNWRLLMAWILTHRQWWPGRADEIVEWARRTAAEIEERIRQGRPLECVECGAKPGTEKGDNEWCPHNAAGRIGAPHNFRPGGIRYFMTAKGAEEIDK